MQNKKSQTKSNVKKESPIKRSGATAKTKHSDSRPRCRSTKFQKYLFNIKQISDLLGISRSIVYQAEKSLQLKGEEVQVGSTVKKLYTWNDIHAITKNFSDKVKTSKPNDLKIKVFCNLKGGVGKSSLGSQVAMRASANGLRTLIIDLDPQAHATLALGYDEISDNCPTILNCLIGRGEEKRDIEDVAIPVTPFLSLVPSNLSLSSIEMKLQNDHRRAEKLRALLDPIRKKWDLIIIDTNPSASLLNVNAILAADELCVVCATDFLSVTGLKQLFEIINDLAEDFEDFGPNIRIIPNLFDVREAIAQESLGVLRQSYGSYLTNTVVRKNVDLKEAQKIAQAVWLYNRKSPAAEDIIALTNELITEVEG
ncbi:MAG: ParA family protein [Oligoflexales bacterium]|nr:ParA family protein [Oligoflexales bacterium]